MTSFHRTRHDEQDGGAIITDPFRELFDSEFLYVCRALRRLGVRLSDVHDVAQELFLSVHARMPTYRDEGSRRSWLYAFVVRFAANYRRLGRHAEDAMIDERLVGEPSHGDALAARDVVLRALDTMNEDQREVLVLHDMEGFSAKEIAALLTLSPNTVSSRLRLAREAFRATVVQLGEGSAR